LPSTPPDSSSLAGTGFDSKISAQSIQLRHIRGKHIVIRQRCKVIGGQAGRALRWLFGIAVGQLVEHCLRHLDLRTELIA
jgi:hypothetical protein